MATPMLPINPERASDEFYRYKMPAIQVKVEGSGNGIKTVLPNIHDICVAINRPEEALMKYFQFDLGAQSTVFSKDDKFLLMGSHTAERMQVSLYDFIKRFVLCRHCHNPETTIVLPKKKGAGVVFLVCNACGSRGRLADHRVLQAMEQMFKKNPNKCRGIKSAADEGATAPTAEDSVAETTQNDSSAATSGNQELSGQQSSSTNVPHDNASAAAATAISEDASASNNATQQGEKSKPSRRVEKTSAEIGDVREHPTMALLRFMKECNIDTNAKCIDQSDMDTLIAKLIRLMNEYLLEERVGPIIIFETLEHEHSKDFFATVKTFSGLFRRFTTVSELYENANASERELAQLHERERKIQISFLKYCAKHMQKMFDVERIAVFVFLLFIEGICKSRYIVEWWNDLEKHSLDAAYKASLKEKLTPIVKWLNVELATGNADNINSNNNNNNSNSANASENNDTNAGEANDAEGGNAANDNDQNGNSKKKMAGKQGKAPRAKTRSARA